MISQVYMICDAYEAGFGKGWMMLESENPYVTGSDSYEAWQIGYSLGWKRAREILENKQ